MTTDADATLLDGIRVLDLATSRAEMTGRVLADMGAEVIKVEPPWGTPSRHLPPFSDQEPERSLYWAAMGFGKRSVIIDLDDEQGRADFRALLANADVLIESFDPGAMAEWGLSYDDLKEVHPELIYVSVTPYGQDGPWARPSRDRTHDRVGRRLGRAAGGRRSATTAGRISAGGDSCRRAGRRGHVDRATRARAVGSGSASRCLDAGGDCLDFDARHRVPAEHRR